MNPYYDAYETSLSRLSNHDWRILDSRWARGIDWIVYKVGKKWALIDDFGRFPLFTTKKAAYEAGTKLILAESRWRAAQQWEQENSC
jgi:hypothetical protein